MLIDKGTEVKGMAQSQTQLQLNSACAEPPPTAQQHQLRKSSNAKENVMLVSSSQL